MSDIHYAGAGLRSAVLAAHLAILGGAACGASEDEVATCPVECASLSESACATQSDQGHCSTEYGDPMGEPEELEYAGCRSTCCEDGDCDGINETQTCAHPPGEPSSCWLFNSAEIPDGWTKLSEVQPCEDFPQCNP